MIQANGSALACGEGSYGRLGQGNSDDLRTLTLISTLQGNYRFITELCIMQTLLFHEFILGKQIYVQLEKKSHAPYTVGSMSDCRSRFC